MKMEQSDVVALVEKLYSGSDPSEVNSIQKELQAMQRSPNALDFAQFLMEQDSKNCKFFGALTFSVVIHSARLSEDSSKIEFLIAKIEEYISELINFGIESNTVLLRKLFSNLSQIFISQWNLYSNPLDSLDRLRERVPQHTRWPEVSNYMFFTFVTILLQDISKSDRTPQIHEYIYSDVSVAILRKFEEVTSTALSADEEMLAMEFIDSWITYIATAESSSPVRYGSNDLIAKNLLNNLTRNGSRFYADDIMIIDKAITVLTDIFEMNSSILSSDMKAALKEILFGQEGQGQKYASQVLMGSDREIYKDESERFVFLIISLLSNNILALAKDILAPQTLTIIEGLINLTNFPGIAMEEETVSDRLVTFWDDLINEFVEQINVNEMFPDDEILRKRYIEVRNNIVNRVCEAYWNKVRIPESYQDIDISAFSYFRSNVADLFITAYSLLGIDFYNSLVNNIKGSNQTINSQRNGDIEVGLYLISKITDDSVFFESKAIEFMPAIDAIFGMGILDFMKEASSNNESNWILLSTMIRFLTSVEFYLKTENGRLHLSSVLDVFFTLIERRHPKLSLLASKGMLSICHECRESLTKFLPQLELVTSKIMKDTSIDGLIRQRMFNSFTSIVVGLDDVAQVGQIIYNILYSIQERVISLLQAQVFSAEEKEYLISLLSSVLEVGNAAGNLGSMEEEYEAMRKARIKEYWNDDNLGVKKLILSIISSFSLDNVSYQFDSSVTEKCCSILKVGLREPLDGPFKFSLETIFNYIGLKSKYCDIDSLPFIYKLIETLVIVKHKELPSQALLELIDIAFVNKIDMVNSDLYSVNASLELFASILELKPSSIIYSPIFSQKILIFGLEGLNANESFVIKSVCKLWNMFLTLRRADRPVQEYARNLMTNSELGSLFTKKLLNGFLTSARSNIDHFYIIFRNLIAKYPLESKHWLIEAIAGASEDAIDSKSSLVNSLIITRGQRNANDILRKVWLEYNGLTDYSSKKF